jgi:hypothetical protein
MKKQIQCVAVSQCAAFMATLGLPLKEQVGVINDFTYVPGLGINQ